MKPLARRSVVALLALLWGFPGHAPAQGAPSPSDPPEQEYDLEFSGSCGLVTRYASTRVSPACLTEAQNIVLDEDFTWSRRRGQSVYNATACTDAKSVRGLWPFDSTDGTRYLIIFSSQSFFSSTAGDCSQITSSTFSATAPMSCAQGLGKLVCSNGADAAVSIDSNLSTATLSDMPRGELVGFFRNRFLTAKIQGALTRIYGSGDGDPTDWTLVIPGRSTSPFTLDIAGTNDGKAVTCLLGEYQNAYFVGRDDELLAIYGNDRRDFTLRKISDQVGCSEPYSVKEKNNALYWISRRGVEKMSGTSITRISDPIRPTIDEILTAAGNSVSATDTTQADFEAGNTAASGPGSRMNSTTSPGSVYPSTWTITDDTEAEWLLGVMSSAAVVNGAVQISTGSPFINAGFEDGPQDASTRNWTLNGFVIRDLGSFDHRSYSLCSGSCSFGDPDSIVSAGVAPRARLEVYASGGGILFASTTYSAGDDGFFNGLEQNVNTSTNAATQIYIKAYSVDYPTFTIQSSTFPNWANGFYYSWARNCQIGGAGFCILLFDIAELSSGVGFSSTTYTSRAFDFNLSTPTFGVFSSTSLPSVLGSSVTFGIETSADGVTWDPITGATDTLRITSTPRQKVRYRADFVQRISTQVVTFSTVTLSASGTGYFISQCRNPGTAITSWGLFSCGISPNDGSISLAVSTGNTCNSVTRTTATWNAVANNTVPSFSTGAYVAYRALFSIDSATQTPTLQDCTINWNEGSDRPDVVAEVYRDRYHLYYTTSTASGSYNDHALVLDQNDKWTIFDGVNAAAVTTFKNKLYIGDSQATGKIYIQDVGHDDLGEPFTMRFRTADLDFGDPTKPKSFKTLYVMMRSEEEPTQDIPVTFRYRIDGATTTYSLGACNMDEAAEVGYFVCKLPFSVDEAVDARWLSVEAEYTGSQGPVRIYGMKFIYSHKERE